VEKPPNLRNSPGNAKMPERGRRKKLNRSGKAIHWGVEKHVFIGGQAKRTAIFTAWVLPFTWKSTGLEECRLERLCQEGTK